MALTHLLLSSSEVGVNKHTATTVREHHAKKSGIYMKIKVSCRERYKEEPKYPNQHNAGSNELCC